MDQGTLTMLENFANEVQTIIGPVLSDLGFEVDGIDSDVDEGGRIGRVVFYRRSDCKIQVYWSSREFEINAMIAPVDAPDEHGLYNRSRKWHYFAEFEKMPDLTLEELAALLRKNKENFESTPRWLGWLRNNMVLNLDAAVAGITRLHP